MSDGTEIIGALELEFVINNPDFLNALDQAEANADKATKKIEADFARTAASVQKSTAITGEALKLQLAQYQQLALLQTDQSKVVQFNRLAEQTSEQLNKIQNAGKKGFDELGNAVIKNTNVLGSAWGGLRRIAQILPGIGVAGIIAFATEPIINYIAKLDILGNKFNQLAANLKAYNDVNRAFIASYTPEVTSLNILYKAATDVNNSMSDRIKYAEKLKEQYPDAFANSSRQAILNGEEAASYRELTRSIIDEAKAKALADQIAKEAAVVALAEIQQQKIKNANAQEIANAVRTLPNVQINDRNSDIVKNPQLDAINASNQRAKEALDLQQKVIDKGKATIEFLNKMAGGTKALADSITNTSRLIQEPLKNFDIIIKNAAFADLENLKAALDAKLKLLLPGDKLIKTYQDKIKQVEELEKKYNPKTTDGQAQDNAIKTQLAAQVSQLQTIDALKAKYAAKQGTRDEQAAAAIKADFKTQVDNINALNVKYDAFVKKYGAKAAGAAGLKRIDPTTLQPIEQDALAALAATQQVDKLKIQIEQQKAIFKEYEDYKLKAGTDAADKLYSVELKGFKDYVDYLKSLQPKESELTSDKADVKANANARKDFLQKAIAEANTSETIATKKHLGDLIIQYQDYQQKREALISSADNDIALLLANKDKEQADQARVSLEEQLTALDEANFKKLDSYKNLFDDIDRLSTSAAKKYINDLHASANAAYLLGNITEDAYIHITRTLDSANEKVNDKLARGLKETGSALKGLGSSVSAFNAELGKSLTVIGDVVSGVGDIRANLDTLKGSGSIFDKISSGFGIVGTAFSLISTVASLFDHSAELAAQQHLQTELQIKASEAVTKALERQLQVAKELYGPERIEAYIKSLGDLKKAQTDLSNQVAGKYQLTNNATVNKYIEELNNGTIDDFWRKWLQQYIDAGAVTNLAGKSLEDLQKLLDAGQLDESTSAIVNNLVTIKQQIIDTQNAIHAELTGEDFSTLEDSIVNIFKEGKTAVVDFADNFKETMQNAIIEAFKRQFLEKQLQVFYDDFSNAFTNGSPDAAKIKELQDEYNKIIADAANQFNTIKGITGVDFTGDSSNSSTLVGAIKGITADQASVLEGTTHGIQLGVIEGNAIAAANGKTMQQQLTEMRSQTLYQMQIAANTKRTADNTDDMKAYLQQISNNTAGSLGFDQRAAGHYGY